MIGYIDIEFADNYVKDFLLSTDDRRIGWLDLTEADKNVLLRNSLQELETLNFIGRKANLSQKLSFPRLVQPYTFANEELPEEIKSSQILNALAMLKVDSNIDNLKRKALQRTGVLSFSLDGFSESLTLYNNALKVTNPYVLQLLDSWLVGSFDIE